MKTFLFMLASISLLGPVPTSNRERRTILAQASKTLASRWRIGTPMPSPRTEVTSVDLNDGIYVIGSSTPNDKNSDIVEMYNVTSNSWRTGIAPLPVPLHHASSVSIQNKIYVAGGYTGDSTPSDR